MNREMNSTKKIVYAGLFLALGLLLPQAFHFLPVGANAGKIFLPMHIPVLLAGFLAGPVVGLAVGIMSPVLSSILFGMPAVLILPAMAMELMTYGLLAGILGNKINNNYVSLILTLIGGRIVNGIMYIILFNLFGMKMLNAQVFFGSIAMGLPGIIIQIILIPILVKRLKKVND
ncbi:MAG: ECF transporter S component [Anaerovoracaceae bacterium]